MKPRLAPLAPLAPLVALALASVVLSGCIVVPRAGVERREERREDRRDERRDLRGALEQDRALALAAVDAGARG